MNKKIVEDLDDFDLINLLINELVIRNTNKRQHVDQFSMFRRRIVMKEELKDDFEELSSEIDVSINKKVQSISCESFCRRVFMFSNILESWKIIFEKFS